MRPLVLVEWIDSHATNGWRPLDEIVESCEPLHCRSVGWLVAETKTMLVLASSISGEKNDNLREFACGDIAIPKFSVTYRVTVPVSKPRKARKVRRV